MNIVNKLTIRHLRQNKRRTLVTIVGVIISVAMIMAVATISLSFMDLIQRQTIAADGEWHVRYQDVNAEQIAGLKRDAHTRALVLKRDRGYAELEDSGNKYKPYLFVREYNAAGFEQFPIELSEGRLPRAEHEIVLSEEIAQTAGVQYEIGDTLVLDIGERHLAEGNEPDVVYGQNYGLSIADGAVTEAVQPLETRGYTVVGFIKRPVWEPTWAPGYTALSYVDESLLGPDGHVDGYVALDKVKRSLYTHAGKVAEELGIAPQHVGFNSGLLRYYGITDDNVVNRTFMSLTIILMAVIIIGSVSLIYNAFAISVSERSRHLGMLSSVGATSRQKRNSVFFEGAVIGLISIPLGIIGGLTGIGITFWLINDAIKGALGISEGLRVVVSPLTLATACAVSLLTILISCFIPARRAARVSAIDAIRQSADIKLTARSVRTSRLVRRLFGFEAEIGLKNLKRNKRKYQATVFSLVISIVLFLSVSYFTDSLKKSAELSTDDITFDIQIAASGKEIDPQFADRVVGLDGITAHNLVRQMSLRAWIDEAQAPDALLKSEDLISDNVSDGKIRVYVQLYGLDEHSLKAYAAEIGADYERLASPDQPSAVIVDQIVYTDRVNRKYVETKSIHTTVGSSIPLTSWHADTGEETPNESLQVAALTGRLPMGLFHQPPGNISIVVSNAVFDRIAGKDTNSDMKPQQAMFLTVSDPAKTQRELEELEGNSLTYQIYNVHSHKRQGEQLILLLSVFTYGFIALITIISIANILNTITTSLSLRKREFAMLRSVGMTPKGFNKMINYESIFYGIKSLSYGLPISIAVIVLIYRSLSSTFSYALQLPWLSLLIAVVAVFAVVGLTMMYSIARVKRENIIDAIKQESI